MAVLKLECTLLATLAGGVSDSVSLEWGPGKFFSDATAAGLESTL